MRHLQLTVVCSLLLAAGVSSVCADSIQLSSYHGVIGQRSWFSFGEPAPMSLPVQVHFGVGDWIPGVGSANVVDVGQGAWPTWEPNSSGTFDFTPEMTGFSAAQARWTNGQPGAVVMTVTFQPAPNYLSYSYIGTQESVFLNRPTDLAGYQIDFVRLYVNSVTWIWDPVRQRNQNLVDTTWEVWGQALPEPAGALLALVGLTVLRRR
jgi:hypothetical protein